MAKHKSLASVCARNDAPDLMHSGTRAVDSSKDEKIALELFFR
ncbi:MAG: hypothetical protein WCO48_02910 [Candidatus Taylorbacteria bacterium]